jgi:predicted dienelactone hydrolase
MIALTLWMACSADPTDPEADPVADAIARATAPGPHPVGYAQAEVTWQPAWGTTDGTGDRAVPVEVWFPTDVAGDGRATYLVAGIVEKDAPLAQDGVAPLAGPLPVAVYSHGSGGLGLIAYPFAERLASHGWLVLAPDHVGNTSFDLITGGEDPFLSILVNRPGDIGALLDAAEAGIAGAVGDTERVFLFGHSFGGYTTFSAGGVPNQSALWEAGCAPDDVDPDCVLARDPAVQAALDGGGVDPRVDAIAPQAPALVASFQEGALAALPIPTLLQSAAGDITTPDEQEAAPAWAQLDDPRDRWIRIPQGGHYSFITVCDDVGLDTINLFQPGAADDGCGPDATPPTEVVDTLAGYLTAFAGAHVLGDDALLPVMDAELHPEIRVKGHGE